jgi:hypothetical protein
MNPILLKMLEKLGIAVLSSVLGLVAGGGTAFGPLGPVVAAVAALALHWLNARFGPAAMVARPQSPR